MLTNYLKIAWRNLLKRRFQSLLNITGLMTGITFAMLIGAFVWSELQVNQSLRHAGRQYLLQSRWTQKDMGLDITTLAPLGEALRTQYPNLVANQYRFYGASATLSSGNNHFRESIQIGDSTLLTMFGFALAQGNPHTALTGANSIVLTAAKARKLFGKSDVLNQMVTVETPQSGKQTFRVTGVLKPLPRNSVSHLLGEPNEIFMGMGALPYFGVDMTNWGNQYIASYVELQPGVTPAAIQKPLAQLIATNTPANVNTNLTAYVTPLIDYYRTSSNGLVQKTITTLSAVAGLILLMAIVNFANIAISGSSARLREIGVRKSLGGLRWQLTVQFLAEALLLSVIATGLSLGLYSICRPLFTDTVGPVPTLAELPLAFGGLLAGLTLVVGSLAGGYPALHLSAYSSVDSLRGKERSVRGGAFLQRGLVTAQFAIAVIVFVSTVIISRQIAYFFTADLGFDKETVLTVSSLPRNWSREGVARMETARDQLARLPGIQSASLSFEIPNGNVGNTGSMYPVTKDSTEAVSLQILTTDENFAQTYQLQQLAGRYFHHDRSSYDSTNLVLNKAAVSALGYKTPDRAIGQLVRFQGSPREYRIGGVVNNFHVGTLHETIRPLAIGQVRALPIYRFFSLRLNPGNPKKTIASIERTWHELFPDAPFDFAFMDQTLQTLYQTELRVEKAAYIATGLALLIVILGVVGLVSLRVTRRTKEVGIRKVLGASAISILGLFLREYVWIILIANTIAWPVAYLFIADWLGGYAYHTPLTYWPFVLVGSGLVILTITVVSLQVIKAALMNPVKSLRSE